jgi:hypothetical protein
VSLLTYRNRTRFADHRLLDGNLLLAADVYYKLLDNADFYQDFMENQRAFAVGSQLTRGRNLAVRSLQRHVRHRLDRVRHQRVTRTAAVASGLPA